MTQHYIATLQQAIDFLRQINQELYVSTTKNHLSCIGAHVRHITDHFDAIKNGMRRGLVDFEERNRGSNLESDIEIGLNHLESLKSWISELDTEDFELEVQVQADVGCGQVEIAAAKSCVNREIMFACSHAVHHYSILKLILKDLGLEPTQNMFGVAPSTANYLRSQAAEK